MLRNEFRHRHVGLLLSLAVMLSAGCGGVSDGAVPDEGPSQTAVSVEGVSSCSELAQRAASQSTETDRLPNLQLPCLTPGPTIDLSALGGEPTLINLWASWCGPCREEMPILQTAHEQYGEQVQFLGVDTEDTTAAGAAFLDDFGITYPEVVDLEDLLLNHLGVPGLPVTVLLDADGRIAGTHVGQLDPESIEELLANVLP